MPVNDPAPGPPPTPTGTPVREEPDPRGADTFAGPFNR